MSYSRSFMQNLHEQTNKKIKDEKIDKLVKVIYTDALQFAERYPTKVFVFDFSHPTRFQQISILIQSITNMGNNVIHVQLKIEDILDNMKEILACLESIFPECTISYKSISFARGRDGKEYDISTLDENLRQLIINPGQFRKSDCIVIDWS
jgi:hypothetical protein